MVNSGVGQNKTHIMAKCGRGRGQLQNVEERRGFTQGHTQKLSANVSRKTQNVSANFRSGVRRASIRADMSSNVGDIGQCMQGGIAFIAKSGAFRAVHKASEANKR